MKKLASGSILVLILALTASAGMAQNQDSRVGIGVMIGEPTGLSFKSWTSGNNAFDLGVAWSIGPHDALHLHADYLWHTLDAFDEVDEGLLAFYIGIGGRMVFADDDAHAGVRIPFGLTYLFEDAPLDIFLEVAPVMDLVPGTDFDMNGGAGVRIYI